MWRLFVSDLRDRWFDWAGVLLVAFFCGLAGGWSDLLISSSYGLEPDASRRLFNAGTATLFLTWVASVPVSASVARLVAKRKEPIYAVWRLLGMRRRYAGLCFFTQMATVSFLGLTLGLLAFGSMIPYFDGIIPSLGARLDFVPSITVICVELLSFVFGGLGSFVSSLNVSPVKAFDGQSLPRKRLSVFRVIVGVVSAICLFSLIAISASSDPLSRVSCLVFLPFIAALFCSLFLRLLLPWVVKLWTKVVPWEDSPVWLVARSKILFYSDEAVAIQMPIAIGVSLVTGLILVVEVLVVYLEEQGIKASGVNVEQMLSFLGAPILVCIAGAVAVVAMSASDRVIEGKTLVSCGSSNQAVFGMAVCESFIHAFNALLMGLACALASGAIASAVCSSLFPLSACLAPSLIVFFLSFVVILPPMLVVLLGARIGRLRVGCKPVE